MVKRKAYIVLTYIVSIDFRKVYIVDTYIVSIFKAIAFHNTTTHVL